jgi:hypothetical protein
MSTELLAKQDYHFCSFPIHYRNDKSKFTKLITRRLKQIKNELSDDNIIKLCNALVMGRNLFSKESILEYVYTTTNQLNFDKKIIYIIYYVIVTIESKGVINDRMKFASYEYIYRSGVDNVDISTITKIINILQRMYT